MTIDRLQPSLGQGILPLALWSTILLTAASCEKDALLPDARRAVLPSGDTVMIDCGDDIPRRSLPDAVRDAIAAEFPGWTIDEVERCDGGMGLTLYLVELETPAGNDLYVGFDAAGNAYRYVDRD